MKGIACDRCGKSLLADEDVRYIVKVEVYAAYDVLELTEADLAQDHDAEIRRLLKVIGSKTAEELEAEVYKRIDFDLCMRCQREYLQNPLDPGPPGGAARG